MLTLALKTSAMDASLNASLRVSSTADDYSMLANAR